VDKCQRCGQDGEDRRTIWMACFYDLSELGIPFKQVCIRGEYLKHDGSEITIFGKMPTYKPTDGAISNYGFYQVRVCKDCRADWMASVQKWFEDPPKVREGCGSGIFVRENGTNVEVTEEEFRRREALKDK